MVKDTDTDGVISEKIRTVDIPLDTTSLQQIMNNKNERCIKHRKVKEGDHSGENDPPKNKKILEECLKERANLCIEIGAGDSGSHDEILKFAGKQKIVPPHSEVCKIKPVNDQSCG